MRHGIAAIVGSFILVSSALAEDRLSPLLTTETAAVLQWTGNSSWSAYEKTASYRALYGSGLIPALMKPVATLDWRQLLQMAETPPEGAELAVGIAQKAL